MKKKKTTPAVIKKDRKPRAENKFRLSGLINKFKSNSSGTIALFAGIILQGLISFFIFDESNIFKNASFNIAVSVFYAITMSWNVGFYTLRGNRAMAIVFLVAESFVNIYFDYKFVESTSFFVVQIVMLTLIPVSVFFYAEELNKKTLL